MVINKVKKSWQTNSRYPNSNYTDQPDNEVWVVEDGSTLFTKIKTLGLRWNPILDDSGNLIDVEWNGEEKPAPPPRKPTAQDDMNAIAIDHEYRLTILELGLTE